jgi:hypothetical protein
MNAKAGLASGGRLKEDGEWIGGVGRPGCTVDEALKCVMIGFET